MSDTKEPRPADIINQEFIEGLTALAKKTFPVNLEAELGKRIYQEECQKASKFLSDPDYAKLLELNREGVARAELDKEKAKLSIVPSDSSSASSSS
jgi:hypothetical protein